jgi:creatinine amidohydrolase/Fe(II)-dependent formamide hydrolase-like protein
VADKFLARHTTASLRALLDGKKPLVALIPVGSTEPHGPHLGLGTDVIISAAACVRATRLFTPPTVPGDSCRRAAPPGLTSTNNTLPSRTNRTVPSRIVR